MWFKRQENVSANLIKRVSEHEAELAQLRSHLLGVEMDIKSLRDKVLRKIQNKKPEEEEEKGKDLYNGMLIPE